MYLGGNHVRVMCEKVWRIAQDCAKKQGLATGSHGWLAACKPPESCIRAKHARSWRVAPVVALQDKSPRLARPFAPGLNLWLNPVARSSRQNTLFRKNWLFTFLLTLLYIYPYTHDLERASRENFDRETLEKTRLTHPQSLPKRVFKFLYSLPLHCQTLDLAAGSRRWLVATSHQNVAHVPSMSEAEESRQLLHYRTKFPGWPGHLLAA